MSGFSYMGFHSILENESEEWSCEKSETSTVWILWLDCYEAHKGKVYGIDISDKIISTAKQTLQVEILEGKLHIQKGCVSLLPFENDTFDRLFHCNCFHFWPDLLIACKELYRVLKPNSFMVTTLCIKSIKHAREKGLLQYGPQDHLVFIKTLEKASFKNVMLHTFEENGRKFEAIIAFT
ncbi:unnamed protein product [Mytilus coruscus]|uniref:Methyltransferase type 11 domain-containing protein n=1 Tax=Mytilus coruscus TaxID=42192 RepID=A0A6J8CN19_MYTCO|nr:unnamed protein product [Mytilus coruscus]CAC5397893.1 unnamed protein product [Mytilus coruscus]